MDLEKYRATISIERLKSFSYGNENITEEALLKIYELNIKVSQSLYPALSIVEIHLRNAIDTMMQTLFSKTWLEDELQNNKILYEYDYKKLQKAYSTLKTKYRKGSITHGKLVSELTFGFWVNLCSKKYNPKIWTKKGTFKGVFVNYKRDKKEEIHEISEKLNKIKKLRNRVFHYEPILYKKEKFGEIYNIICEIIAYLPQDNSNIFKNTNQFPYDVASIFYGLKTE